MNIYLYLLTPTAIVARISLFRVDSRLRKPKAQALRLRQAIANAERLLQGKRSATANGCGDFRTAIDLQVKLVSVTGRSGDCSDTNCRHLVLDWTSLGSGKFGKNPRLCRNCDEAKASSQNTGSERTKQISTFQNLLFLALHREGVRLT